MNQKPFKLPIPKDGGPWDPLHPIWNLREWAFEPKWDGHRTIITNEGAFTKTGVPATAVPQTTLKDAQRALTSLGAKWLDCELTGVRNSLDPNRRPLIVFDAAISMSLWFERRERLEAIISPWRGHLHDNSLYLTPVSYQGAPQWEFGKRVPYVEGIVCKPVESLYHNNPDWIKFKY